jgi:site-specific recombinase XerD
MNLEHFKTYIKDVRGVSERTAKHYERALFTINALLEKYQFETPNLFHTTDIEELDRIKFFLDHNEEFQTKDTVGHRMYSVAFKHYYRFSMWYK